MRRFRILQIFSRYFQQGGEEAYFQKFRLAAPPEWEVLDFEGSSAALIGSRMVSKLALPIKAFHDFSVARSLRKMHAAEHFDAWIVQNALPGLTPAVYQTAFEIGVPLIQYLHNYRMGCTNGFLLNHGQPCQRCLGGNFWPAFATACWRNSRLISGAMGLVLHRVRALGTFQKVSVWIALHQGQKDIHVKMGIPADRIHVVPHFFIPSGPPPPPAPQGDILFLGRLSPEKGLDRLLHAWKLLRHSSRSLYLAGTGPEEQKLRRLAAELGLKSVRFLGFVPAQDQPALWARTSFSVLPSLWPEPFPLAFLESWAHARPVVASRLGAMAETIEPGLDGLLVDPSSVEALAAGMQNLIDHAGLISSMGQAGLQKLLERFNKETWISRMREVLAVARENNPR
jgi:glycosyltransferase involved in cell wall biosynthesis